MKAANQKSDPWADHVESSWRKRFVISKQQKSTPSTDEMVRMLDQYGWSPSKAGEMI